MGMLNEGSWRRHPRCVQASTEPPLTFTPGDVIESRYGPSRRKTRIKYVAYVAPSHPLPPLPSLLSYSEGILRGFATGKRLKLPFGILKTPNTRVFRWTLARPPLICAFPVLWRLIRGGLSIDEPVRSVAIATFRTGRRNPLKLARGKRERKYTTKYQRGSFRSISLRLKFIYDVTGSVSSQLLLWLRVSRRLPFTFICGSCDYATRGLLDR